MSKQTARQYGVPAQYPSETESARRERNGARLNYRTTTEIRAKLDAMAEEDQMQPGDFLDMLVEGEWEHRREQRAIAEHKRIGVDLGLPRLPPAERLGPAARRRRQDRE